MIIKFKEKHLRSLNGIDVLTFQEGEVINCLSDEICQGLIEKGIAKHVSGEPKKETKPLGPAETKPIEPEDTKEETARNDLTEIKGIGPTLAHQMNAAGINTFDELGAVEIDSDLYNTLVKIDGVSEKNLNQFIIDVNTLTIENG